MTYDVHVVGAGITGLTIARRLADEGLEVLVVDRRDHIGGNCFDELDKHGTVVHRYGPHVFHTASDRVYGFLSCFTAWRQYAHRVLAYVPLDVHGRPLGYVPMPVNATTMEMFFGIQLDTEEAAERFLGTLRVPTPSPANSEEVCLDRMGRKLYEAIFEGYTKKAWGRPPRELSRAICARVPTRTNKDDRYFDDRHQVMPRDGYRGMFEAMADHDKIDLQLGVDGGELEQGPQLVWTGCMDEAFDYALGRLPWRSVEFKMHHVRSDRLVQPAAVINHPSEKVPYTRSTEYRWLTGQAGTWSCLHREFPNDRGEPFYPVLNEASQELANKYRQMADESGITLAGRLGRYQYLEMGQACANALKLADGLLAGRTNPPAFDTLN